MSRQLRRPSPAAIKNYTFLLLLLCISLSVVVGDNNNLSPRGDALLTRVQSDALEAQVIALQENIGQGNRHAYRTRSAHHREATENTVWYIKSQFRRSPRLQISEQVFGGIRNVTAVLPPRLGSASNRVFIVCAHYDTQAVREPNWNPLASTAPGANDNGTGVAAMLEIANLLSRYEYDHELRFIALGGEELGFLGSRYYVQSVLRQMEPDSKTTTATTRDNIVSVFNLDMFGFNWKSDLVEIVANNDSAWISRALIIANGWYKVGLKIRRTQDEFIDISSHKPFWDNGYDAVTLTESSTPWRDSQNYDANPFYHTAADTADKVNFGLMRKVTQLVLVTIDSLLTDMFNPTRQIPRVTLEFPPTTQESELTINGTFHSDFPIDIIVHPSQTEAVLHRETQTYTARVPLKTGENTLRVIARYPLGAVSVAQSVILTQAFAWKDVVVFPNPARSDGLTEFRVEANTEITEMHVLIYDAHGNLIKRVEGVADRLNQMIWRTWWNQQTSYGLAVSPGIYVCHISVVSKGETYTYLEKLAILR